MEHETKLMDRIPRETDWKMIFIGTNHSQFWNIQIKSGHCSKGSNHFIAILSNWQTIKKNNQWQTDII